MQLNFLLRSIQDQVTFTEGILEKSLWRTKSNRTDLFSIRLEMNDHRKSLPTRLYQRSFIGILENSVVLFYRQIRRTRDLMECSTESPKTISIACDSWNTAFLYQLSTMQEFIRRPIKKRKKAREWTSQLFPERASRSGLPAINVLRQRQSEFLFDKFNLTNVNASTVPMACKLDKKPASKNHLSATEPKNLC